MTSRLTTKVSIAAVSAVAFGAIATAVPATAASWNGISGTVYSPCSSQGNSWYNSSNQRTKSGTSKIDAQFGQVNKGGLSFRIINTGSATVGSVKYWTTQQTNVTQTLVSSMSNGSKFYTSFKQTSSACGQSPYNFSGSLYY